MVDVAKVLLRNADALDRMALRIRELEESLKTILAAVDKARLVRKPGCGVGGQTIEANIKASAYNGVDAWTFEVAREVLENGVLRGSNEPVAVAQSPLNSADT